MNETPQATDPSSVPGPMGLTELLDGIELRANAATPAPWPLETVKTSCGCCYKIGMFPGPEHKPFNYACIYADGEYANNSHLTTRGKVLLANAQFIAAARSDVPKLLQIAREARRRYVVEVGPGSCEQKEYDAALAAILES